MWDEAHQVNFFQAFVFFGLVSHAESASPVENLFVDAAESLSSKFSGPSAATSGSLGVI